jgi:maleylpyruvate isomerase
MILHGYWRSSAVYRLRIALALKGLRPDYVAHHLRKNEQFDPEFLKLNPQGLVPALVTDGGAVLTQSLAIIEWLDETHPYPALLPNEPVLRAQVRAFTYAIACEIHPIQNLRIGEKLKTEGFSDERVLAWNRWVIQQGLNICERIIADRTTRFCFTDSPSLADIVLVPQLYNARRFGADASAWRRLRAVEAECLALPAFTEAAPEKQPDAE